MVHLDDHPDLKLCGQAKGMRQVLIEQGIIWKTLVLKAGHCSPVGTCQACKKSELAKDAEAQLVAAAITGDENEESATVDVVLNDPGHVDDWCCMLHVLSLQSDFKLEKPLIQHYVEEHGHKWIFLPKFHCKLNPIEMMWGYAKYHMSHFHSILTISLTPQHNLGYRAATDGKFKTARDLVPKCLDSCNTVTIHCFF